MSDSVQMPALGESVTEGTVTRWLKQIGERVEIDEPLLEVSTDKVDTEVPSPFAGILEEILVGEDETVDVGAPLARIGSGVDAAAAATPEVAEPTMPEPPPVSVVPAFREPVTFSSAEAPAPLPAPSAEPLAASILQPSALVEEVAQPEEVTPSVEVITPEAENSTPTQAPPAAASAFTTVDMPALGESVTEGTVTRWLKKVGESIAIDEALLEVSTDKVDTEVPSPIAGTISEILVGEDETVEVGTPLVRIVDGDIPLPTSTPAPPTVSSEVPPPVAAPVASQIPAFRPSQSASDPARPESTPTAEPTPAEPAPSVQSVPPPVNAPVVTTPVEATSYVTPLVRKLASAQGVNLGTLAGTGIGGRIRKQDVLDAAEQAKVVTPAAPTPIAASAATKAAPSPLRGTTEKMTRLRKLVAQRMVESLQTSAQLTTVIEVDMTRVARLRTRAKEEFKAREGVNLTFLPFFALAALEGLKAHPKLNASIDGDQVIYHGQENLGIAVDTERGLVVPVIKDAGDLNIGGITRKIADLASRTRENKVGPDELSGGTFTITNTGSGGALFDTPIIAQPQVAILGTGTIVKRPVVVTDADGAEVIAIRSMVYLSLSYDHRLVDGADAARYLMTLKQRLEEGAFEADLGL